MVGRTIFLLLLKIWLYEHWSQTLHKSFRGGLWPYKCNIESHWEWIAICSIEIPLQMVKTPLGSFWTAVWRFVTGPELGRVELACWKPPQALCDSEHLIGWRPVTLPESCSTPKVDRMWRSCDYHVMCTLGHVTIMWCVHYIMWLPCDVYSRSHICTFCVQMREKVAAAAGLRRSMSNELPNISSNTTWRRR